MADAPSAPECDFCGCLGAVVFYDTVEYVIPAHGHFWASGDRFYACPACRGLVDAGDWTGLIAHAGLGPLGARVVTGFRDNHSPGATVFPPGSNPEQDRGRDAG